MHFKDEKILKSECLVKSRVTSLFNSSNEAWVRDTWYGKNQNKKKK